MSFAEYRTYKPYPYRVKKYTQFEWDCIQMPGADENNSSEVSSLLMGIFFKNISHTRSLGIFKTINL